MGRKRRIMNAADEYAALVRMTGEAFERRERIYRELDAADKEHRGLRERLYAAERNLVATAPRGAGVHDRGECSEEAGR